MRTNVAKYIECSNHLFVGILIGVVKPQSNLLIDPDIPRQTTIINPLGSRPQEFCRDLIGVTESRLTNTRKALLPSGSGLEKVRQASRRGFGPTFTAGWVMSVAHLVVVPAASVALTELTPWDAAHDLAYDHAEIIRMAVDTLRSNYRTGVAGKPAKVFRLT